MCFTLILKHVFDKCAYPKLAFVMHRQIYKEFKNGSCEELGALPVSNPQDNISPLIGILSYDNAIEVWDLAKQKHLASLSDPSGDRVQAMLMIRGRLFTNLATGLIRV